MRHDDWTPDVNDPAFEAGYAYVTAQIEREYGMHGPAPWWYGWAVCTAFWNGMRYEQQRQEAARAAAERNGE